MRNKHFTGRDAILEELEEKLFSQGDCQRLAIVGLGGVGKTQVALQFAHQVQKNHPEYSIGWLPVLSLEGFKQAYQAFGSELDVQTDPSKEPPETTVQAYLSSEESGRWLLIVDNADDSDLVLDNGGVLDILPDRGHGLTVFTTRSLQVGYAVAGTDIIELQEMEVAEARELIDKSLFRKQPTNNTDMDDLLRELTYLPLAITHAIAYLNLNQVSVKRYLELLRGTEQTLADLMMREFRDDTQYRGSHNALATTWLLSFAQIRKQNSEAAKLLESISCIEPKSIPRSILPMAASEIELDEALGLLLSYTFLTDRDNGSAFDMHSLVHVASRVWVSREVQTEEVIKKTFQYFEITFTLEYQSRQVKAAILPHVMRLAKTSCTVSSEARANLLLTLGFTLSRLRRFEEAAIYLQESREWYNSN